MQLENPVIFSSAYFGPISYYAILARSNDVLMDGYEHYVKQTYRNRCRIMTSNGIQDLIVPVIKVDGNHTRVKDVHVSYSEKWPLIHWRAIQSAYSKSPYFLYYSEEIEFFFRSRVNKLFDLNEKARILIAELVGFPPLVKYTESYIHQPAATTKDYRNYFSPKHTKPAEMQEYTQVFIDRHGFKADLSILDLLFNRGPDTLAYLESL